MRGTYLWFLQLITGILIAFFLGIHMVMMHLGDILGFLGIHISEPTSWTSMIERADQGTWLAFYILLLAFALYHGLNGLRSILLELSPSAKTERIMTWAIVALGIVAFALGTYVPVALFLA